MALALYRRQAQSYWRENVLTPDPEPHWVYVGENPYKDNFPNDKSGTYIEGPTKGYCGLATT
jgi:hypothetical protein